MPNPSSYTISQRRSPSGRNINSLTRSAVALTKRRETADLLVSFACSATAFPTGWHRSDAWRA